MIEAGPRSGARLEARLAAEQGRPVYVPRRLLEREPWARAFTAALGAAVIDDAGDVLADLEARRERVTPGPADVPTRPASGRQLSLDLDYQPV